MTAFSSHKLMELINNQCITIQGEFIESNNFTKKKSLETKILPVSAMDELQKLMGRGLMES